MTFSEWVYRSADDVRGTVNRLTSGIELLGGMSYRDTSELELAATQLRMTADWLDREAKKRKEAQHEHA